MEWKSSEQNTINRSEALLIYTHTLTQLGRMSERGSAHTSERENNCWRSSFLYLGFTASIGAHSIFEEVEGFLLYGFPKENICVYCLL